MPSTIDPDASEGPFAVRCSAPPRARGYLVAALSRLIALFAPVTATVAVTVTVTVTLAAALTATLPATTAIAEDAEISARRAAERRFFTDAQIAAGFFKVAFGAEMQFGSGDDRIRKYTGPVRIYIDSRAKPDRSQSIRKVVADIGARIANLDIAVIDRREDANFLIHLVRDSQLSDTIQQLYGERGAAIVKSLEPQCLSGFRKDAKFRITGSDVILVVDAGEFIFYDCAYEEILQALGPIQDTDAIPWTMFNDDVQMGFFGLYDQYILNILYHKRIEPGMTPRQVKRLLPEIMPEVRAFVAGVNALAPRRSRPARRQQPQPAR